MLWMLPLRIWSKFNKKKVNKRAILNAIEAILILVLYIVILFIVRYINN